MLFLCAAPAVTSQQARLEHGDPPRADRITLSAPAETGLVTITGAENSVYPGAIAGIRNLYSGELVFTPANFLGAFSARLPGVPGNPFLIQTGDDYPAGDANFPGALPGDTGVIVRAPGSGQHSAAGLHRGERWTADVIASAFTVQAGDAWNLALEITTAADDPFAAALLLQPIAMDTDGTLRPATVSGSLGWSAETTPTGIPLDGLDSRVAPGELTLARLPAAEDGSTRFRLAFAGTLPEDLAAGLYAPLLALDDGTQARLSLILNVGQLNDVPLAAALFMDESANGMRGLLPGDAVGGLSHGARWNGPDFILPPGRYPLEPYLPALLLNRSDSFAAPLIPFDLPGGELHVTVAQPNGSIVHLNGTFTQNRIGLAAEDERARFGGGPTGLYRLTTGNPALTAYAFDQYGAYTITLDMTVSDLFGNRYRAGGSYSLLIAETLQLFPGLLSGAPIPAGQPIEAGLRLSPPVPANITAALEFAGLDGAHSVTRLSGRTNRYGIFLPANALTLTMPGEYRFDVTAAYTDAEGRLWAGSLRSAGVVSDPEGPLIAHGARGTAGLAPEIAPARYNLRGLMAQTGNTALLDGAILNQPFYSGGLAQLGAGQNYGLAFSLQLQDTGGDYARWLIDAGAADGLTAARGNLPSAWPGYAHAYISAVTPAVSVRQQVTGGPAGGAAAWVDADDPLNQQIGAGIHGLAVGDMVFLFGGAVVRAPEAAVQTAAGYAALALITGSDDPAALGVLAPAQLGAAPLAFIPTGAFPGQRLTVGDPIVIAGHVAPPLPARVSAEITSPDGHTQSVTLQANEFGYAFDPAAAISTNSSGVWTVRIRAATDSGEASVPGTNGGAFSLYVLPANAAPLAWNQQITDSAIPGATAYNFNLTAPEGWSDVRGYVTLTTPGAVLADGEVRLAGRSFSTQYNPADIRRNFPGFEVEGRVAGAHVSDVVTLTVAFTGLDADGAPRISARAFTFRHDRLIALESAGGAS